MNKQITKAAVASAVALALGACGGGGGDTTSSGGGNTTRIVSSGPIEGFGSVIVNGVKFEVGDDSVSIENPFGDDSPGSQDDLQIGMVVTVSGTLDDDGSTGQADSIRFDDDLEGPISGTPVEDAAAGTKTFSVLGVTVVVSASDTVFDDNGNYGYADLAAGHLIEVSGLFDDQGRLLATYIERKTVGFTAGVTLVEVKGTVSNLDTAAMTFNIGSLQVDYSAALLDDSLGAGPADGQFVEVKGTLAGNLLSATKVEREGFDDSGDGAKVHVKGVIADLDVIGQTFSINGQPVSYAGAVEYKPASLQGNLDNGLRVEVEGPVVEGVLQAREIEIRNGQLRIHAPVQSVDSAAGSFTLRLIPGDAGSDLSVRYDTGTRGENGIATLGDIAIGDFLEVRARPDIDDPSLLIATRVEREQEPEDHRLQGPLQSWSSNSATLLGVTYNLGGNTEYEGLHDEPLSQQQFFELVASGTLVKVKDKNDPDKADENADGIADELSLED